MEAHCPDCNTELTPSIVGYLCHGCGNVHTFNKVSELIRTGSLNTKNNSSASKTSSQKSSHSVFSNAPISKPQKTKFRHKLKKAFVPEITKK